MSLIGNNTIRLEEVDSTNRYLMELVARDTPEEGTLVLAGFQTAGRGTDGTGWESEPSRNLTFSFVLYPGFLPVSAQFGLNKVISLGLTDLLKELLPGCRDIRIKWPNDIYTGDYKVAGTLIQNGIKGSRFAFSVIGIGLNVNQVIFRSGAPNPVSLKMVAGKEFDLDKVLQLAVAKLETRYESLKQGNNKSIDEDYQNLLYRLQELSGFIYKGNHILGKITGVSELGRLILEIPGEKQIDCDMEELKFEI